MTGLAVRCDVADAVREAQRAFEQFGAQNFPRAVQFALTGVAMDAVGRWRAQVDSVFDHPNAATRDAVRYVVDRDLLGKVQTVGEAQAAVFVLPLQSIWLKYSFGDGQNARLPGDVGVEAYFGDQSTVKIPNAAGIAHAGLGRPGPGGKIPGRDAKAIARLAAAGYKRNTGGATVGSASWGAFEVKAGDVSAGRSFSSGPGIYARPPRIVAAVGRKKVAKAIRAGKRGAPTTSFTRGDGTGVTVPKVVNSDVPRLLFLSAPKAEYKPVATPSWQRAMDEAAATMGDRLARELTDRLERMARKGKRR